MTSNQSLKTRNVKKMRIEINKIVVAVVIAMSTLTAHAEDKGSSGLSTGKHLFILSGQSNMERLDPHISFIPAVEKEFGKDNVIVVKSAQGGQPIRRWCKEWKDAKGNKPQKGLGDLYDKLMGVVNEGIKGQTIATVTFVWMQGERDAKERHGEVYEASFKGLIGQLKEDLKKDENNFVIGRLSDYDMQDRKCKHWTMIRKIQVKLAEDDPKGEWVDNDDLNEKGSEGTRAGLHYTNDGYKILGERFAEKAIALVKKNVASK